MSNIRSNNYPKVSVIIPVYNVERYLAQCIDSILSQTFIDFELLLINDGSIDSSSSICEEYVLKDSRVRLLHQTNAGASAARNRGIDEANGDFICFVDSDDWVERNYLSDFFSVNFDININSLIIQTYIYYEYTNDSQKSNWHFINYGQKLFQKEDILNGLMLSDFFVAADGGPVGKLFQKKIINEYNIRFSKNISAYEDVIFSLKYISKIDNFYISDGKNYHYLHRDSHISLSKKMLPYHEYLYSAKEGEEAINYLFDRFNIENEQLKNRAKIKMLEIKLTSIYALYKTEPLTYRSVRVELLESLKKETNELLQKHYRPRKMKDMLTKRILLMNSTFISDTIFICLYKFAAILNKI